MKAFPQLSESFIEGEIRVVRERGIDVTIASLEAPAASHLGPTDVPEANRHLVPSKPRLLAALLPWAMRRPVLLGRALARALRERSQTMLRGVVQGPWIASAFRRTGVQHVHAHFATDAASAAMVAAELLGVPWTFTIHARELYLRTGGLWAKCEAADAVVTVCDYNVAELERACGGRLPQHLEIIRCGVDPDRFVPSPTPVDREVLQVVSVGRLVPKKGFADLIDAMAILSEREVSARLDIIGSGELGDELARRIHDHGLSDLVRLHGSLGPAQVAAAVRDADVFVLANVIAPDGDRDSMPVVTKEAMACAVPVVTTDIVGNPEMVDDAVGRLVPPHDPHALAAAIEELAAMPAHERRALGLAGRRRIEDQLSLQAETSKLLALFDDCASRR